MILNDAPHCYGRNERFDVTYFAFIAMEPFVHPQYCPSETISPQKDEGKLALLDQKAKPQ